jgi:hypothetical protein
VQVMRTPEVKGELVHVELKFRVHYLYVEAMLADELAAQFLCFIFVAGLSQVRLNLGVCSFSFDGS